MPRTIVTLRLSDRDLALIDRYVGSGDFTSRSELIRFALKNQLKELLDEDIEARHVLSGPGELSGPLGEDSLSGKAGSRSRNKRGVTR